MQCRRSGSGTSDSITILFGIRQIFGNPASILTVNETGYNVYSKLKDPETGNQIINWANYNRVLSYYSGSTLSSPDMMMKDVPDAISITIQVGNENEFYISNVDYIKGNY